MTNHPEQKKNEHYLGNTSHGEIPDYLSDFKTIRVGKVAFEVNGKVMPASEGYLPLFVGDSEFLKYDSVMMTRTFGPDWKRNR